MRKFFILIVAFCLTSCSTNYYLCTVDVPTAFYQTDDTTKLVCIIPVGKQVIANKKSKKYRKITYGAITGYIYPHEFFLETPCSSKDLQYLTFNNDSTYTYARYYSSSSESSSSSSNSKTTGGTVNVKGYYKKNGTYVKPYTRSAPKRKS